MVQWFARLPIIQSLIAWTPFLLWGAFWVVIFVVVYGVEERTLPEAFLTPVGGFTVLFFPAMIWFLWRHFSD